MVILQEVIKELNHVGFEGGQMPLQRRVPKFGFTNINRKEYSGINLDKLQLLVDNGLVEGTITFDDLIANRLVGKRDFVKILGGGTLSVKVNVQAHKFTASAQAAIESVGGTIVTL